MTAAVWFNAVLGTVALVLLLASTWRDFRHRGCPCGKGRKTRP